MVSVNSSSQAYFQRMRGNASALFATLGQPAANPFKDALDKQNQGPAALATQARHLAVTGALKKLGTALDGAAFNATRSSVSAPEAIMETLPRWVEKDVFTTRRNLIETPVYGTRPVFETQDIYSSAPVFETRPKFERQDVYETRDIIETRDVYETRDVVETRDIFEARDLYETRDIVETRDVYETRDITETRDVYETRNIIETREIFETRPVYEQQAIQEAVIDGNRAIGTFASHSAAGIDNGADFSISIGGSSAAVIRFTNGQVALTRDGSTRNFSYSNGSGNFAAALVQALNAVPDLKAELSDGRLKLTGRENASIAIAEVANGFFDFSGSPLSSLGLRAGTVEPQVTGYRQVQVGTEQVLVGTEDVVVGTEEVLVGTEDVVIGTEDVLVGTEDVVVGTEEVLVGTEQVLVGTEDVVIGTEEVLTGTEDVIVGTEEMLVGQRDVQVGTESIQTGWEQVKTGTRQVQIGEERYIERVETSEQEERVKTGTEMVVQGSTSQLVGFREPAPLQEADRQLSLDSQRRIRDGVLLLQQAIGPSETGAKGSINPYAEIRNAIDLERLQRAYGQSDIGASPVQVAALLKQLSGSQSVSRTA
ncbi:hypothetical protein [Devosia chinhatensis]|uniref:Uncharacterized protein n=1 Tax=Devosia chinhatensis TaxID=429727 RepID=A0A0F5FIW5_9HYPH|nr:hypothetical protein [Devosia chinhatensis]KKB08786.1 hypothetical protein VE26_01555 [Devosia chinhatensis]